MVLKTLFGNFEVITEMKPKILSQKIIFEGSWIKVRRSKVKFKDGKILEWDDIIQKDTVVVIPIDSKNNVYLTKEWRSAWNKDIFHVPIGTVEKGNSEKGRIQQARNELREEIGLDSKRIKKIAEVISGARSRGKVHIYLAQNLYKSAKTPDEGEFIKVVRMPFKKAYNLFVKRKMISSPSNLAAFLLAKEELRLK